LDIVLSLCAQREKEAKREKSVGEGADRVSCMVLQRGAITITPENATNGGWGHTSTSGKNRVVS